jgi:hypothetical protein
MKGVLTIITEEQQSMKENAVTVTEIMDDQLQTDFPNPSYAQPTVNVSLPHAEEEVHSHAMGSSEAYAQRNLADLSVCSDHFDELSSEQTQSMSVTSSVSSFPTRHKKHKTVPRDVSEVRRSNRIVVITAGYKDKDAAMQAAAKEVDTVSSKVKQTSKYVSKKNPLSKKSNNSQFTAVVRDHVAPPPPELPMETIQVIGREQCQILPEDISADKLLADV